MSRSRGANWRVRHGDAAMVVSPRWREEPPQSRASRWRERLGWVAALSLALHLTLVAFVFLAPPPPRPPISSESPPGEVALVFQGGSNTGPSSPTPSPEVSVGPPSPETALTAPPAGAIPQPEAARVPPPPPPAQSLPAPPVPPAGGAPPPIPLAMLPAPQVVPPSAAPQPQATQSPAPPVPRAEPARPRPAPPRPRVVTPPRPDAFPKPLNFAFGGSVLDGRGSTGRAAPHDSMGPVQPGATSRSAFNSDIRGNLGADYRSLLRAWLERHKYYPQQAAEEGEDGTASVRVVVRKDGSVREVELEERSGSQWLDMGAQALFRGQKLPAFPPDTLGEEQEILITIHYILIRG